MQITTTSFLKCSLVLAALALPACGDDEPGTTDSTGQTTQMTTTVEQTSTTQTSDPMTDPTTDPTSTTTMTTMTSMTDPTGGEETETGGAALDCGAYCSTIMANCGGGNAQYASEASCMGTCAAFAQGTAADMAGNTLGCRTYHAGAAAMDPALHCAHAGPSGGGGACGDYCESFCQVATQICPTENPDATCVTTCMGFDTTEPYDASDAAGNTYACRLYHLTVAATDDASATMHCPHTGLVSPPCM